jgi:hypothetical protein
MAFLTAQGISNLALELLVRTLVLPRTVAAVPGEEFHGANGDTISVRVRQPRAARVQVTPGAAITLDEIDEVAVDVQVRHLYNGARLTDETLTLQLEDFGRQVLEPCVSAIAVGAENEIASAMNALTVDPTIEFAATATEADTIAQILAAREFLGENDVPAGDRWFAVAPDIATRILTLERFTAADATGSASALRDATIGKLFGFNFVESTALDPGTAVAYHRSAFVFANRPPVSPRGAADSAVVASQGISLRSLFDYDADTLSDRYVASTFAGAAAVFEDESATDNQRFVKIGTGT